MKRIVICVIMTAVLTVSLCGCIGQKDAHCEPQLNMPFTVNAAIKTDDMESQAVFTRLDSDHWDVEFSQPDSLSGVKLSFSRGMVEASYKGLSFSVPKNALPLKSVIAEFISVIEGCAKKTELSGREKDGELLVEGDTDLGGYVLKFGEDNKLSGFEMENMGLVMTFEGFTANASTPQTSETAAETTACETSLSLTETALTASSAAESSE